MSSMRITLVPIDALYCQSEQKWGWGEGEGEREGGEGKEEWG